MKQETKNWLVMIGGMISLIPGVILMFTNKSHYGLAYFGIVIGIMIVIDDKMSKKTKEWLKNEE